MIFCDVSSGRELSGGIGNNFFKIAACLSLAKSNDVECKLSHWRYDVFENLDFKYKESDLKILYDYREPNFHYDVIKYIENMKIVNGYFQSEKYFKDNEDYIRHCFTPKDSIVKYIDKKYADLLEEDIASIHVRRGDYLHNGGYHVLGKEYYTRAIDILKNNGINKFVVFSDDPGWCKINFKGDEFRVIENEPDYIDLFFMSMFNCNIIANSSFSWWAAWLNSNNEKIVVSPKKWFDNGLAHLNDKDIIPEKWKRI